MNEFLEESLKKLEEGSKGKFGRYEEAMKGAVKDQLADFCRQDGEFAQAVAQGGSFSECMAAVAKGVGQSLSDLEAYQRAAQFYFPGAKIWMEMHIDLTGDAAGEDKPGKTDGGIILDFRDFL